MDPTDIPWKLKQQYLNEGGGELRIEESSVVWDRNRN